MNASDVHQAFASVRSTHQTGGAVFKILIICSDLTLLLASQEFLEHYGFRVFVASEESVARQTIQREHPDIVVISPGIRMVVTGVPAVIRMLEDPERLLKAVHWAAREVSGQQETTLETPRER